MNWYRSLKGKVRLREPLKNHTTFKIGGPARYFIEPKDIADLKLLLNLAKRYNIPILVLGSGSNILVSDRQIEAAILRLNSDCFKRLVVDKNCIEVGAGCLLSKVILAAKNHGLSGIEALSGIPGTIGGALVMNAGQARNGNCIGDFVENVTVMDYNGKTKVLHKRDLDFSYRRSNLEEYIILGCRIKLVKKNKEEIRNKINAYLRYRKATQDLSRPSAGCIFKNPSCVSAGKLIDLCGLKGKRIGGAAVSLRHANFIVNLGRARSSDVLRLIDLIKKKVKNKFGIILEPEIKIWH